MRICRRMESPTASRCGVLSKRQYGAESSDHRSVTTFSVQPSPIAPRTYGVGIPPHSYWQRGLDMYTLVQQMVDQAIGEVVAAIPKSVLANTVIVFASDHGEYAGAHGVLSGKAGTAYEEAIHVPLIVTDLTNRDARQVDKPRRQLASSVDLAPMLVTLGNRGSSSWRRGKLRQIYGERLDLVELLANPSAAGRDHILFSTDEIIPGRVQLSPRANACARRSHARSQARHLHTGSRAPRVRYLARCSSSTTTTPHRKGGPRHKAIPTIHVRRQSRTSCSHNTCHNRWRPRSRPSQANGGEGSSELHQIRGAVQCAQPGQAPAGRQARDLARVRQRTVLKALGEGPPSPRRLPCGLDAAGIWRKGLRKECGECRSRRWFANVALGFRAAI